MSKDFEFKIKTQKEAKKVQEAPPISGLKGRMAVGFESEIKKAQEAKKMQEASKESVPISKGLIGRMAIGFESEIKAQKEAKKMQQNSIKPLIDIIDNANLQNPNHAEELKKVQTQLANCFKENKLAAHNRVDQYLKSEASQDRQEVMKDSKLPFKDKIYSLIVKMSDALGISSLKNYCQKKLDEHAVQR
ncbi:hypothetical protein [Rickettsia bellii]|nr:hypothetical protein [Rickettsia bellii]KJV92104.1 hypothetical protein RBEMOGI_0725 [Rickettsia bellii str. RML Mogi]